MTISVGGLARLVRREGATTFKLALVLGYTRTGKVRIRVWSANSARFSNPQSVHSWQVQTFQVPELSSAHLRVLRDAARAMTAFNARTGAKP